MSASQTPKHHITLLSLVLVLLLILSSAARADLFGFAPISNNSGISGALAPQIAVDVTDYEPISGLNQVLFTFYNDGPPGSDYDVTNPLPCMITAVYFDDGALLGLATILDADVDPTNYPGVYFDKPATPGDLPGGDTLVPPFATTADFSASRENGQGGVAKGVDPGESLGIVFDLKPGYDFAGVLTSIGLGWTNPWDEESLRIGVRIQSFGDDNEFSEALLHTPAPGAMILGMLGLGVVGLGMRRFA
jgi:hypothetical protein